MTDVVTITSKLVKELAPLRPEDGHKGTFGTALICAGSKYMTGAAVLCASSCLRSGVGMVKVFAPDEALDPVRMNCPCALTAGFGETPTKVLRDANAILSKTSAVAIGPGIDTEDSRYKALLAYLLENAPRLVIDASALGLIAKYSEEYLPLLKTRTEKGLHEAVLTPHIGEFKRLIKVNEISEQELLDRSVQFALENKCVIALKNHKTFISDSTGRCYINNVSNSGLAKGGSGDVLTGIITGLLAQGISPIDATVSGVHIHSLCGKIAEGDLGSRAMIPEDLPLFMADAFENTGW